MPVVEWFPILSSSNISFWCRPGKRRKTDCLMKSILPDKTNFPQFKLWRNMTNFTCTRLKSIVFILKIQTCDLPSSELSTLRVLLSRHRDQLKVHANAYNQTTKRMRLFNSISIILVRNHDTFEMQLTYDLVQREMWWQTTTTHFLSQSLVSKLTARGLFCDSHGAKSKLTNKIE